MASDRTRSEANILFGGLLVFWCIAWLTYLFTLHRPPANCTATSILLGGACVPLGYVVIVPFIAGVIMLLVGTVRRPIEAEAEDLVNTDPFTRMVVACFASMTVFSLLWLAVVLIDLYIFNEAPGVILIRGVPFTQIDGLGFLAGLFFVLTLAVTMINLTHVRRRQRFLRGYTRAVARNRS